MKMFMIVPLLVILGCARAEDTPVPPEAARKAPEKKVRATELTPLQYHVTQNCGTEPAFRNKYWNHKEPGIYVDIVSGEPLFASVHKFQSGSGWPSFTEPLVSSNVVDKVDRSHGLVRTEVRSKDADSHLGHVFNDGPGPQGLRYCINSAALRFVPVDQLEQEGLGRFLSMFEKESPTPKIAREDGNK